MSVVIVTIRMSSPLKGIERITEDLKLERQKANSALQERARLRIEIETLKQKNDNLSNELAVSKESVDSLLYQLEEKKKEISLIESREENNNSNNVSNYKELLYYKEQYNNAQQQNENLLIQVKEREAENKILISKLDGQENRFSSKDQLIEELKKEVELLRSTNSETEEKYLNCYEELQEKLSENQGLQSDLARLESAEYNYNNLVDSNDSLRNELDNVLNANSELQDNLRELTAQIQEKDAILSEFEAELDQLSNEKQFYLRDIADLELTKTEIINTMNAEIESAKAAKELADSSIRNREFLGDQLQELKDLHQEALEKNIALEQELTTIKSSFNLLKNDFLNVKESLMQAEAALEEEKGREFMDGEIETLRAQLNDVRKQLIRRDLEDEAGSIGSRAAMDREQSGRQVSAREIFYHDNYSGSWSILLCINCCLLL